MESKGAEFDIAGRINENWSLIGSYSHDDARILQGNGISDDCGGGILCTNLWDVGERRVTGFKMFRSIPVALG